MLRSIGGGTLCLVLALLLSGCPKKDPPPAIPICIGDGVGGADCDIPGKKEKEYWAPSELENAWITTQDGAARLLSWCYGTDSPLIDSELEAMRQVIVMETDPEGEN